MGVTILKMNLMNLKKKKFVRHLMSLHMLCLYTFLPFQTLTSNILWRGQSSRLISPPIMAKKCELRLVKRRMVAKLETIAWLRKFW